MKILCFGEVMVEMAQDYANTYTLQFGGGFV